MSDPAPAVSESLYPPSAPRSPWWSTWEDVLDVCYAPTAVFERRRDGRYLGSFLVVCVVSVLVSLLSMQVMEAVQDIEFQRAIQAQAAAGTKMTQQQLDGMKAFGEKMKSLGLYFVPVLLLLGTWVGGLIVMALARMLGGKLNFAQASTIALLSSVPELLERVLVGAQGLVLDTNTIVHRYSFSLNAARFMPSDTNKWLMKAGAIADPFVIWSGVVIGIGVYVIGRMEKEKAAVAAVLYVLLLAAIFR